MRGTKYLSKLVDVGAFQKNKLNIIQAPTGSGKSYFALKYIPQGKRMKNKIIYKRSKKM